MRWCGVRFVVGLSLLSVGSSHAASLDARERAARKACMTGNPSKGVEILADLYIDTRDATYIYNQGRCLEQNHKCDDAIERFREYLRKIGDNAVEERAETQNHIHECQAILGIRADDQAAEDTTAQPAVSQLPFAGQPIAGPAAVVVTPSPRPEGGARLRIAGIVAASAGLAAAATGLIFNLKYNSGIGDIEAKYDKNRQSSNETNKTLAIVGYGVGGACLAGGAILYYVGWKKDRVVVTPGAVAGNPGAFIAGGF
jgi:hypothetical protein